MYKTVLCIDPSLKQSGIAVVKDGAVVYKTTASGLSGNFNIIKNKVHLLGFIFIAKNKR